MRYRKLDENGDYSFGKRLTDFWIDVPDAPAQAVMTRLMLWKGEWFLDRQDGTPWDTEVLGKYTENFRDAVIRSRSLDTPGVKQIVAYFSQVNRETRHFSAQINLDTDYGGVYVPLPFVPIPTPPPSAPTPVLTALTTQGGTRLVTQAGDPLSAQRSP